MTISRLRSRLAEREELEIDGVVLSSNGESLTLSYRAIVSGVGEKTG